MGVRDIGTGVGYDKATSSRLIRGAYRVKV